MVTTLKSTEARKTAHSITASADQRRAFIWSVSLRPEQVAQRREARHLIAERFECGGDRDREEHARDAPDEPPKQHTDHDRERVELQPAGVDKWRHHVVLHHRD